MLIKKLDIVKIGSFILTLIILLISPWNISIFYIPALIMIGSCIFSTIYGNDRININWFEILIISALLNEIVNYFFSIYKPNSILSLFNIIVVLSCVLIIGRLIRKIKYKIYLIIYISFMAGLIALINIPMFYFKYYESIAYGFNDFSQLRFLYTPMGLLSNEWVTLMLCLLPFPILAFFITIKDGWRNEMNKHFYFGHAQYLFLLIIALILFNLFISFSRAGYLSFFFFVLLINTFFLIKKIFSIKNILLFDLTIIFILFILFISFSSSSHSTIYSTSSHQRSTEGRFTQWNNAMRIVRQKPFYGVGAGNYALYSNKLQNEIIDGSFSGRVNNSYLQLLCEKGVIGFSFWSILFLLFSYKIYLVIKKDESNLNTIISIVVFSSALSILFRELFFSSLFYNNGILFLFMILLVINGSYQKKVFYFRSVKNIFYITIAIGLFLLTYYYINYIINIGNYNKFISNETNKIDEKKQNYPKQSDGNSLFYAAIGLEYERDCALNLNLDKITKCNFKDLNQSLILESIKYYQKAHSLNLFDDLFIHNLAWLYYMNNQPNFGMEYILKAIKISPNTALYHISKGLMLEKKDLYKALIEYKEAIKLSPDICDSYFFYDLKKRQPQKVKILLKEAYYELQKLQIKEYSPIIEARIGKILLSTGEYNRAYFVLSNITIKNPNLNRPWYYLGIINEVRGNSQESKECFRKSSYLNLSDYLPVYGLAKYYENIGNIESSEAYANWARDKWKKKKSSHAFRTNRMYYLETNNDDIIPKGLFDYISPLHNVNKRN